MILVRIRRDYYNNHIIKIEFYFLIGYIKMVFIYVLHLENNKYYVGRTKDIEMRIEQHAEKEPTCEWLKLYKFNKKYEIISNNDHSVKECDNYDEDKYTILLMSKVGIENVRGGSFTKLKLDEYEIMLLNKMIMNASDKCFTCGKTGHYSKECPDIIITPIIKKCTRCGRDGHTIDSCIAKTHYDGHSLVNTCIRCGRKNHSVANCYAVRDVNNNVIGIHKK